MKNAKRIPKFSQDDIKLLYDFLQSNKKLYSLNKNALFFIKTSGNERNSIQVQNQMNYLTDKGLIKDIRIVLKDINIFQQIS